LGGAVRVMGRWAIAAVVAAAGSALLVGFAGVAQADETNQNSYNGDGSRQTLVDVGQVDDPMEDVLEHFLDIGSEGAEPPEPPEPAEPAEPADGVAAAEPAEPAEPRERAEPGSAEP